MLLTRLILLTTLSLLTVACGSGAPSELQCPPGTRVLGGPAPSKGPPWWSLSDDSMEVEGLSEAWPFPAWAPMKSGDASFGCISETGSFQGPLVQVHTSVDGTPGAWVRANLDDQGRLTGAIMGGWDRRRPEVVAFEGGYHEGLRAGNWKFYTDKADSSAPVAEGRFERGEPHGRWIIRSPLRAIDARYVYGHRHGQWHEQYTDGREVDGHYFNGTRNYEWEIYQRDPRSGSLLDWSREAWKYDTFVARWNPDSEKNPLPTKDVPYTRLGPNAEGICEVHARCASNAYFTALLAGHALDADEVYETAILVDYANTSALPPVSPLLVLVNGYTIEEVKTSEDEHSATSRVRFEQWCRASGPGQPIVPLPRSDTQIFQLRDEDGTWKFVDPPTQSYVRFDVYYRQMLKKDPIYAAALKESCRPLD